MNPAWTSLLAAHGSAPATPPAAAECCVVPLVHLAALDSTGPDSTAFLNNLLSNDVATLSADRAQWSSFSTPKGRMLASFLLWPRGDGHALVLAADLQAAMAKKLGMYVLRSKVKLTAADDTLLIGVCGAKALATLERAGLAAADDVLALARHDTVTVIRVAADACLLALPAERAEAVLLALREAGATPANLDVWQQAMIRAGLPLITAATQDEFVPQMVNLDLIGGVNFKKGCYPGQEIVARTQYLGKLKKRTVRVTFTTGDDTLAQPGSDLFSPQFGEQSAGKLLNVAAVGKQQFEALAVLQMGALDGPLALGSPAGPTVQLLDLPYLVQEEPAP